MRILGMSLSDILITIPAVLICITFHEYAHGWMADRMGDPTPRATGRLSLNPWHHLDPIGFLCLLFFGFGWAKPVQVNPRNFKNYSAGLALTAAAGPMSNMILAFVFILIARGLIYASHPFFVAMTSFLVMTSMLSIGLGMFNLLPIPPLDGSKILMPILPAGARNFLYQNQGIMHLILLVLLYLNFLSGPLGLARNFVFNGLLAGVDGIYGIFGL